MKQIYEWCDNGFVGGAFSAGDIGVLIPSGFGPTLVLRGGGFISPIPDMVIVTVRQRCEEVMYDYSQTPSR